MEEQESTGLIKGVSFGVIKPGGASSKTLFLLSSGSPGNRVLDVSMRSRAVTPGETGTHAPSLEHDHCETLETLVIPAKQPFVATSEVVYHRSSGALRSLMDLGLYDQGGFDPRTQVTVSTSIVNSGPWELELDSVKWDAQVSIRYG